MSRRALLRRMALLAALGVAGCAGLGRVETPPRVSLADVSLAEFGLLEQALRLSLNIQNPNDSAIEIRALAYTLDVNGAALATGVSNLPLRVDAYSTGRYEARAQTSLLGVLRQLQALARGGREHVEYRLHGDAEVTGLGRVPFDQRGELPLPGLLGPWFDAPAARPAEGRGA